jgi:hypothetical protein
MPSLGVPAAPPKITSSNLVHCLDEPSWKVQEHSLINYCGCDNELHMNSPPALVIRSALNSLDCIRMALSPTLIPLAVALPSRPSTSRQRPPHPSPLCRASHSILSPNAQSFVPSGRSKAQRWEDVSSAGSSAGESPPQRPSFQDVLLSRPTLEPTPAPEVAHQPKLRSVLGHCTLRQDQRLPQRMVDGSWSSVVAPVADVCSRLTLRISEGGASTVSPLFIVLPPHQMLPVSRARASCCFLCASARVVEAGEKAPTATSCMAPCSCINSDGFNSSVHRSPRPR